MSRCIAASPQGLALCVVLVVLFAVTVPSFAATLAVPASYATIQLAIDAASNGDTVQVSPGTYHESVSFLGKRITLRSTDPGDWNVVCTTIVDSTGLGSTVQMVNGEPSGTVLEGLNLVNSNGSPSAAVLCGAGTSPTIRYCRIVGSSDRGIAMANCPAASVSNCLIASASGRALESLWGRVDVTNCTIAYCYTATTISEPTGPCSVTNCIVAWNRNGVGDGGVTVTYCDVYRNRDVYGNTHDYVGVTPGVGCISVEPFLYGDYRPASLAGRWDGAAWITDSALSPCVDAGDPGSPVGDEPAPNGGRINMGYDGGTKYASKSAAPVRIVETGDRYASIQAAVNAATVGQTVEASVGCYYETVDFLGKQITVRSTDPGDWNVVSATYLYSLSGDTVRMVNAEPSGTVLEGFTIYSYMGSSYAGVRCGAGTRPTVRNCSFPWSYGPSIAMYRCPAASVSNCLFTYGYGRAVESIQGRVDITNCTIANCVTATTISEPTGSCSATNCIVAFNTNGLGDGGITATYCDVYGNTHNYWGVTPGVGCISVDPLFGSYFRLQSRGGRWSGSAWVRDSVHSPCIDAGDPASSIGSEPAYSAGIVNMGFDGGMSLASKSTETVPPTSQAGPLDPSYAVPVIDVPYIASDAMSGVDYVSLWYRRQPLGGAWGAWTKYVGNFTASPISFDSSTTGGVGTYEFCTIATDVAGNVEPAPESADCTTVVANPAPTITGLAPDHSTAGGAALTVTVNGTNFVATSQVRWGGSGRTTTYVSATQLTAAITVADIATAGTAAVTVFSPVPGGGTAAPATFTINNPAPTLTGLAPTRAFAGGPGFTLTLTGTSFVPTSQVKWGGSDRTTTYTSATQVTAAISAADIATAGTASVTVTNPAPGGGTSGALSFAIYPPGTVPVLAYTGDTTNAIGNPVSLKARLTFGGDAVSGIPVDFVVGGYSCSGTTGAGGEATATVPANRLQPGAYRVYCYSRAASGYPAANSTGDLVVDAATLTDTIVSGDGYFAKNGKRCQFQFGFSKYTGVGTLTYMDYCTPARKIVAGSATSVTMSNGGHTATVSGSCTLNGVATGFTLVVTDTTNAVNSLTTDSGYAAGPAILVSGQIKIITR